MNYPRRRTQVLKSDAPNPHGSAVVRPQIDSKLFRAKLNVIYRYAKPYTLGGMV